MLGLLFLDKTKFKNKWLLCEKQPLVFYARKLCNGYLKVSDDKRALSSRPAASDNSAADSD